MSKFDGDFIQYNNEKVKEENRNLAFYLTTRITFYIILIFFAIFFIWYTYFISTHKFYAVEGVSMMSTLNGDISDADLHDKSKEDALRTTKYDAVYVDQVTKPKVFDIVVIERGGSPSVIKRLMAVAGDYITIAKAVGSDGESHYYFFRIPKGTNLDNVKDEQMRLEESGENGYHIYGHDDWDVEALESDSQAAEGGEHIYEGNFYETFLKPYFEDEVREGYFTSSAGLVYSKVPQGQVFYMGDNRGHSTDAREKGCASAKDIVGRAEFIVYDYNFVNRIVEVMKFYYSEMQKFFAR